MTRRVAALVALGVLGGFVGPAQAQVGTEPTAWAPEHRALAGRLGDAAVVGQAAGAGWTAYQAWRAGDHKVAYRTGCSLLVALATTETTKRLTHEWRPDGSDQLSQPSGHSAALAALSGWNYSFGISIGVFGGLSRANANKHHLWNKQLLSDIPLGWGIGALSQAGCRALIRGNP